MIEVREFEEELAVSLPDTHKLLRSAGLVVHLSVSRITLHGSRGLAGGHRPDSDIDLCLIVDTDGMPGGLTLAALMQSVLDTTLSHWGSGVEADLAAVFDTRGCGLRCFERTTYDEELCSEGGLDCFGLYKIQKGFDGFVDGMGLEVRRMYPCLTIWRNKGRASSRRGR